RLDDACGFALEHALPTYRFVRNYLNRRDRPEVALDKAHSLLRELDAYRVLLDEIVETQAKGTP
ncbi:MAG: hypothetical protein KDD47_11005, partial [Acidobacteria bacterium]|nr:hypothetical protein [Acidobacteriota bacterium]